MTETFLECLPCAWYYAQYFCVLPHWLCRSLHESLWNIHRINFPRHLGKVILHGTTVVFATWLWEGHSRHSELGRRYLSRESHELLSLDHHWRNRCWCLEQRTSSAVRQLAVLRSFPVIDFFCEVLNWIPYKYLIQEFSHKIYIRFLVSHEELDSWGVTLNSRSPRQYPSSTATSFRWSERSLTVLARPIPPPYLHQVDGINM